MSALAKALSEYTTVSLDELNANAALMDRRDTKYVVPLDVLPLILEEVMPYYKCLDIGGIRTGKYVSQYFDSNDYQLYLDHQNRRLNRFKVRYRTYLDSGLHFFEVKFKSNKMRTQKTRIKVGGIPSLLGEEEQNMIQDLRIPYPAEILVPAIRIYYGRSTLVNLETQERVTLDTDLCFEDPVTGNRVDYPGIAIIEIKQPGSKHDTAIFSALRKFHVRKLSLSKYCFGLLMIRPDLKHNTFKNKFRKIVKLTGDSNHATSTINTVV